MLMVMVNQSREMRVHTENPLNAEPESVFKGPHYIRSHGEIPTLINHTLRINFSKNYSVSLCLSDLKTDFSSTTVTATLQCAGNRRSEMLKEGLLWNAGAIGTACYTGVFLKDIFDKYGFKNQKDLHVEFVGADKVAGVNEQYTISVPIEKVFRNHVILAWQKDGENLSLEHGYPLRSICLGYYGARSVKWLKEINIISEQSSSYIQKTEYYFKNGENSHLINDMPVNSCIVTATKEPNDMYVVTGWAFAGEGRKIIRIEVATGEATNWIVIPEDCMSGLGDGFSWRTFTYRMLGKGKIWVRAMDSSFNSQPELMNFNTGGYVCNAFHSVNL